MAILKCYPTSYINAVGVIDAYQAYTENGINAYVSAYNSESYITYTGFSASVPGGTTVSAIYLKCKYNTDYTSGAPNPTINGYTLPLNTNISTFSTSSLGTNYATTVNSGSAYFYIKTTSEGEIGITLDAVWFEVVYGYPPTFPASISYSSSFGSGATVTLSCGASTDTDGDLAGYSWEVNYNASGVWTALGTSASNSKSVTITAGKNTVQFRVRAYDSGGLYSGYTTGTTSTISNGNPLFFGMNF